MTVPRTAAACRGSPSHNHRRRCLLTSCNHSPAVITPCQRLLPPPSHEGRHPNTSKVPGAWYVSCAGCRSFGLIAGVSCLLCSSAAPGVSSFLCATHDNLTALPSWTIPAGQVNTSQASPGGSTPLACGPSCPELSKSNSDMAYNSVNVNVYIYTCMHATTVNDGHACSMHAPLVAPRHRQAAASVCRVANVEGVVRLLVPTTAGVGDAPASEGVQTHTPSSQGGQRHRVANVPLSTRIRFCNLPGSANLSSPRTSGGQPWQTLGEQHPTTWIQ